MNPEATASSNQGAQASAGYAQIHILENKVYDEAVSILTEYTGFIFTEVQKPEPMSQEKLGTMLAVFVQHCMQRGVPVDSKAPAGATCKHRYVKTDKAGQECGAPAKFLGIDNLPKCSSHKASKPSKQSTDPTQVGGAGVAAQTFSYSAQKGQGRIAPQALTTVQAAIREQTEAAKLELEQAPDGRVFNRATNFVFEQRDNQWIAVGVINGPQTNKLTAIDTHVCFGNQWKWDPNSVEDPNAKTLGHPLVIGANHPLVAGSEQTNLIARKIESVVANNSAAVPMFH
jgi:hypothetical protein